MSTADRAGANVIPTDPNTSKSDVNAFGESILRAIHEQMNGKTAEDAQQLLDELIETLRSEHNDLNDVPRSQTLVIEEDAPSSSFPPTKPSSLISMSVTSALIPLSATPMPSVERSAVNIIADALGPTSSKETPLIVTQTVYVTATPSNVASASAKASSTTSDEENAKSMADLMNKYNNGTHDYSRTIIILLCLFGSILVIGMLIAGLWWRKDRKRRQKRALDREKEMEEQSRRPPGGYAYDLFMASKQGLNTRQPQDYFNETGPYTSPTAPPNNSSQPSGALSQPGNAKKYKGKATNLPAINTGSAQEEDPPISPTFIPLPGTPMKLVSRQQVFQDPQRRRGVDALDTDAQQESNQKHWKSVHSDDGIASVTNTKSVGQASSGNKAQKLMYESSDDSDNTISPSNSVNNLNANINAKQISSEADSTHRSHYEDGHQKVSDIAAARRFLTSVDI